MNSLKDTTIQKLHLYLENGYKLQAKFHIYETSYIPKNNEIGFNPNTAWNEFVKQGYRADKYKRWMNLINSVFYEAGLDINRFKNKTLSVDPKSESTFPAALFKRQLAELDKIVNDPKYYGSYKLTETYPRIYFKDDTIGDSKSEHRFTSDIALRLIELLWDGARIVNQHDEILQSEKPIDRSTIYESLNINHSRFVDIVRTIHTGAKRKSIKLDIKFPKKSQDVFIVLTQDFM